MANNNEGLIDHYIDPDGIKRDTQFILDQLNQVEKAFQRLNNTTISLGNVKDNKELVNANKEAAAAYSALKKELGELQKAEQQAEKVQKQRTASTDTLAKALIAEKEAQRQQTAELKNAIREEQAAEGSIEKMRAALIRLNKEYDNLSAADRNATGGQDLLKNISALSNELKKLEGESGRHQRSVGNYGGALSILEKRFEDIRNELSNMSKSGKQNDQVIEALTKEYSLLGEIVNNQVIGFAGMQQEIKANTVALQQLDAAGLKNTETYKALFQETVQLKDNFNDLKEELKFTSDNISSVDKFANNIKQLAAAYQIAEGSAALFGVESEELEQTMVRLLAVQNIANGVFQLQEEIKRKGSIANAVYTAGERIRAFVLTGTTKATQANTVATAANTAATNATTVATRVATGAAITLRAALIATGIGALLILLPAVANGMGLFGKETDDAAGSQNKLNDELERTNSQLGDLKDQFDTYLAGIDRQTKANVLAAKSRGASEAELATIEQQGLARRRQELQDQKRLIDLRYDTENNSAQQLAALNTERVRVQAQIEDTELAIKEKAIERAKAVSDKRKEQSEKDKKARETEAKAAFNLQKFYREQEINELKNTAGDANLVAVVRTKARTEQLEKEEQLITVQRDFELKNAELTASELKLIEEKAAADLLALRAQYVADLAAIRIQQRERDTADAERDAAAVQAGIDNANQAKLDSLEKSFDQETTMIERESNKQLRAIDEQYLRGEISKEQHEEKKIEAETDALRRSLLAQMRHYQALIVLYAADEDKKQEALNKIAELEKQLTGITIGEAKKRGDATKQELEQRKQKMIEIGDELRNLAFDLFSGDIDREKNAIQGQIDALEAKKQKEIEVENQRVQSAQERAANIAVIEARANAERERLERRQRQLDVERARFERARAITQVIQNTAVAVVGFLKDQNYPMAILSGILGAAQLSRILAQPIPRFFKGKDASNNYEGPAIVDDGGKAEAIVRADGSVEIGSNQPRVTWIGRDDIVLPDANDLFKHASNIEMNKAIAAGAMESSKGLDLTRIIDSYNKNTQQVVQAIKNIPKTEVKGYSRRDMIIKFGANATRYLND